MAKQPKQKNKPGIEPDIIIHKEGWTPPKIEYKIIEVNGRKTNAKCVYCGKEYHKPGAKSNLKVCDECIKKNEYRVPPKSAHLNSDMNETVVQKKSIIKIIKTEEKQQVKEPSMGDIIYGYDLVKDGAVAQEKQNRRDEEYKDINNEVNRIILALMPETPEPNREQDSKITKNFKRIHLSGIVDLPCVGCNNFKEHYILSESTPQKPMQIQEQNIQQTIDCLHKMDFCDQKDFCGELCRKLGCYKCMDYLLERYNSKELQDLIFERGADA